MGAEIEMFASAFPRFLAFSGSAAALLIVATIIYILLTPWKELALVRGGNGAAGLSLAGAIAGLALPISSALASSISILDLVMWGGIALLLQLLAYRVVDLLLRDMPKRIENDEAGAAIVLLAAKLSSALILAAGLWDPVLARV